MCLPPSSAPLCEGRADGRCRPVLCNGTLCHVLPTWRGRGEKKEEEKVSGCSSGGMSRVGNLSVSTHVSAAASCSSGTVHLSACVSARLAVWHPLLPTLPDFEREQSHYFSHGDEASHSSMRPHAHIGGSFEACSHHPSQAHAFFFGFFSWFHGAHVHISHTSQ